VSLTSVTWRITFILLGHWLIYLHGYHRLCAMGHACLGCCFLLVSSPFTALLDLLWPVKFGSPLRLSLWRSLLLGPRWGERGSRSGLKLLFNPMKYCPSV
jgi:hypothetical protein